MVGQRQKQPGYVSTGWILIPVVRRLATQTASLIRAWFALFASTPGRCQRHEQR
jgi:hypothetical protein